MPVKLGNGTEAKAVRTWNGSKWVNRMVRTADSGGNWILRNYENYNFTPVGSCTISEDRGGKKDSYFGNYAVHSKYSSSSSRHIGYYFFDYADIQAKLKGKTIAKVDIYLYRINTIHGHSTPADIHVYAHPFRDLAHVESFSWNSQVNYLAYNNGVSHSLSRGEGYFANLSISLGEALRDNVRKGIAVYDPNHDTTDYAYLQEAGTSNDPLLRIWAY